MYGWFVSKLSEKFSALATVYTHHLSLLNVTFIEEKIYGCIIEKIEPHFYNYKNVIRPVTENDLTEKSRDL